MTLNTRRIYFGSLCFIFILCAPVLVYYSKGWRFDGATRKLVLTGSLSVTTTPADAQVLVNGEYIGMTPIQAHRLVPGTYRIDIQRDGYVSRTQSVQIEGSRGISLQELELFPSLVEPIALSTDPVRLYSPSPTSALAAVLTPEDDTQEYIIIEDDRTQLMTTVTSSPTDQVKEILWNPDGTRVAILFQTEDALFVSHYDREGKQIEKFMVSKSLLTPRLTWDPDNENRTLFIDTMGIYDSSGNALSTTTATINDILFTDEWVYTLVSDTYASRVERSRRVQNDPREKLEDTILFSSAARFFVYDPYLGVYDSQRKMLVLLGDIHNTLSIVASYTDVEAFDIHPTTKELLLSTGHELSVVDKEGNIHAVVRYSEYIGSPKWIPQNGSIIYTLDDTLFSADVRFAPPVQSQLYSGILGQIIVEPSGNYLTVIGETGINRYPLK